MPSYVLRLWVPDRPGALGAVASRVGAVGGDVVGIDILERGGGRAIDELVVSLADAAHVSLLLDEVRCVDGVDVEELRPVPHGRRETNLAALETAELIIAEDTSTALIDVLVVGVARLFEATWGAVVELPMRQVLAVVGSPPPVPWLVAFVQGSRTSLDTVGRVGGAGDIAWAQLPGVDAALVIGRDGRPFHERERRQLEVLARIADRRLDELLLSTARLLHPSAS